ncbi:uncharacterized protein LOC114071100, partial [Empidonax traillii]|uniref:uncharacterized protein LOC114071100 n=1 Tax=Empidonax traillii TaxID=164674 RepID=UPI000FFD151E
MASAANPGQAGSAPPLTVQRGIVKMVMALPAAAPRGRDPTGARGRPGSRSSPSETPLRSPPSVPVPGSPRARAAPPGPLLAAAVVPLPPAAPGPLRAGAAGAGSARAPSPCRDRGLCGPAVPGLPRPRGRSGTGFGFRGGWLGGPGPPPHRSLPEPRGARASRRRERRPRGDTGHTGGCPTCSAPSSSRAVPADGAPAVPVPAGRSGEMGSLQGPFRVPVWGPPVPPCQVPICVVSRVPESEAEQEGSGSLPGSHSPLSLQPWGFPAREFLRKKLIGKEVCFTVEYKTPQGREYGMVYLGKGPVPIKGFRRLAPQPPHPTPGALFAVSILGRVFVFPFPGIGLPEFPSVLPVPVEGSEPPGTGTEQVGRNRSGTEAASVLGTATTVLVCSGRADVMQVLNADAIVVKLNSGDHKTIHLSSIRPPRLEGDSAQDKNRKLRPLYDIPYMFEAREFLRKKLIGKKVNVSVDYIRPASSATETVPAFSERTCATVSIGGMGCKSCNSLPLIQGLGKLVRALPAGTRMTPALPAAAGADSRCSLFSRAIKNGKGLHSKKEVPIHRVADISGDTQKAKQFLPFLQRAGRSEAVVEYVFSGSRLKLFLPKETCLITFLLAGIECPRGARNIPGLTQEGEPFSEEATLFTKELVLQREHLALPGTADPRPRGFAPLPRHIAEPPRCTCPEWHSREGHMEAEMLPRNAAAGRARCFPGMSWWGGRVEVVDAARECFGGEAAWRSGCCLRMSGQRGRLERGMLPGNVVAGRPRESRVLRLGEFLVPTPSSAPGPVRVPTVPTVAPDMCSRQQPNPCPPPHPAGYFYPAAPAVLTHGPGAAGDEPTPDRFGKEEGAGRIRGSWITQERTTPE